jgi:multidrug efflux pump subunit AcrB
MNFNVSSASIRNPVPSILIFVLLTLMGIVGFRSMKVQNFPDIDLPTIIVTAALPGAAPAQLETEVARKIENSIASIQGLKHIYSTVQDGAVTVSAEFRLEKNTQQAVDDVRDAISRVRSDLPGDLRDPVITKLDFAALPVLVYTVSSTRRDDEALSWFVDNDLTRSVLAVKGVGSVGRVGGVTRQVQVELDPLKLMSLGATASDVSRRLRQVQQDASGGRTDVGGAEQSLRTIATVGQAQDLAALEISLSDGKRVRLDQLATVRDTVAEVRSAARLNGQSVVAFEVSRSRGASEVEVAKDIVAMLQTVKAQHPDITFTEAFNFVEPVVENYEGSMKLLLEGSLLAVLVVFIFLRNLRATFVSAVALPLSVIPTFAVMHWMGFSINVITLLSLSLVVGILVDDAIVEIENIQRHLEMGKSAYDASMEAADEIGLAVIATTFALIAVFLPTAFMSGVVGKFFLQFGWTAAIAVFFSLVVARMLTPMMAAYMLKRPKKALGEPSWIKPYMAVAQWCLRHRWLTMLATLAFTVLCIGLLFTGRIAGGFIPPDDLSQTQVRLTLPPGSTFRETLALTQKAEGLIKPMTHVRQMYTAVGGGKAGNDPFIAGGDSDARKATITLNLTPRGDRPGVSKQAIEAELRQVLEVLPGARVNVGFGGSSERFNLVLAGDDGDLLTRHGLLVEKEMRSIPGIGSVSSTASLQRPELLVRPDAARAADAGVTTAAIADTLRIATTGDFEQALPKLNLSQRQVPVVVKLPDQARTDLELLARLPVPGARGPVPLGNVATLELGSGPAQIGRYDRQRNITFEVELNGQPLQKVQELAYALPSLANLPPGVIKREIGDAEAMAELASGFGLAMGAGVLCIYFVLVLLFHAWIQPVTILVALVLSIPGAILALVLTKTDVTMPALIGMIMLMGIATKNSILLVEYAVMARRDRGLSRMDALLDACRKRARPIVMTTIAMGAGMLPIAIGFGTDPSFRSPMAIVVIGGLITSTFLSLLVIPVIYSEVDDVIAWFSRRFRKSTQHQALVAAPASASAPSGEGLAPPR